MRVRAALVFVLLVPALAGCAAPAPTAVVDGFDRAVPHCVGACGRMVYASPVPAYWLAIAVNPLDPDHLVTSQVVISAGPPQSLRTSVSVSTDAGESWETRTIPSGPGEAPDHPLATYPAAGFHAAPVFLPDGTLVMSAGASQDHLFAGPDPVTRGDHIYTMRSTDGGRTWGDVRFVERGDGFLVGGPQGATAGGFEFNYNAQIAVGSDGLLLIVWTQVLQGHPDNGFDQEPDVRLLFATSNDGGLSWSRGALVDDEGFGWDASPVIGSDGIWRVAYVDRFSGLVRFATSADRGGSWDITPLDESPGWPSLKAQTLSTGAERLLLAYGAVVDGQNAQEPVLTWSDDGGTTWAPPVVLDAPQGRRSPQPYVAGGAGDSAWVTYVDFTGASPDHRMRFLVVKVVDGVAGAPLLLDEAGPGEDGHMALAASQQGDAVIGLMRSVDGASDVLWAHVTGGDHPVPQIRPAPPSPPPGLDEPVEYEFTGHVNLPGCYAESDHALDAVVRDHMTFEFEVPTGTRFVNATLDWEMQQLVADLDLFLYNSEGDLFRGADEVPERFSFEIEESDQGTWTALVQNCENAPTDFTLEVVLS